MQAGTNSKRLALVIGNSFYEAFSELKNSKNDAEDVKVKLESLGFDVDNDPNNQPHTPRNDADVINFTKRIHKDVTDIVFYYAGHGCSIRKVFQLYDCNIDHAELGSSSKLLDGENFLVPIDGISPDDASTAKQTYIRLDWLIDLVAKYRPQDIPIIIIVDCCRAEVANGQQVHGDPIKTTAEIHNVIIMYATANGHVAMDGGRVETVHSPSGSWSI